MKKMLIGLAALASVAAAGMAAYRMFRHKGPEQVDVDDPRFAYPYSEEAYR